MRRGVFEPNDTDRPNNSALFGGTVSDSCDAVAFSYATQTEETDSQFFWVLIVVVVPFVMLIYFGLAFVISGAAGANSQMLLSIRRPFLVFARAGIMTALCGDS